MAEWVQTPGGQGNFLADANSRSATITSLKFDNLTSASEIHRDASVSEVFLDLFYGVIFEVGD